MGFTAFHFRVNLSSEGEREIKYVELLGRKMFVCPRFSVTTETRFQAFMLAEHTTRVFAPDRFWRFSFRSQLCRKNRERGMERQQDPEEVTSQKEGQWPRDGGRVSEGGRASHNNPFSIHSPIGNLPEFIFEKGDTPCRHFSLRIISFAARLFTYSGLVTKGEAMTSAVVLKGGGGLRPFVSKCSPFSDPVNL